MRVELRIFPTDDAEFAAFARATMAALPATAVPAELQAALRRRYPAAVVREQDPTARISTDPTWYVFRYGSARAPGRGWWTEPGLPSAVLDDARAFVEVDDAFAAVLEIPAASLVGRRLESFANPADPTAVDDLLALWLEFRRSGEIESSIRYNFADGRPREIAYRLVRDADGPGRHRLVIRELG